MLQIKPDLICLNPPYLPRFSRYSRSPCITRGGTLYYPLMECIATAFAEKSGFKARAIDAVAENYSREDTIKFVKDLSPRLITVATSTPSIYEDIDIAERIKRELPQTVVMLVGRHASWAAEETLSLCHNVDGVIRQEYYRACVEILSGKTLDTVKGVTFKEGGEIIMNEDDGPLDPNDIPLISPIIKRDLDIRHYFYASIKNPYTMLQHSWGCSYNCDFCNEFYKSSYRHRKPELTIEELKFVENDMLGVKEVFFDDPTFVINEKDTAELCRAMIANKIKLTWSCQLRCSVSYETLRLMKEAGCRLAQTGNESFTQEGKDSINKKLTLESEEQFLRDAKKAGILIHGCFIIGLPTDNDTSVRQTIDRAKMLPFDSVQIFPLIPTPNTSTWKWVEENNFLVTEDYSKWLTPRGGHKCVISRPGFSNEDVERWIKVFIKEFYFRPSYIVYKLKQSLKSWQEMKRNLISAMNLLRRLKS